MAINELTRSTVHVGGLTIGLGTLEIELHTVTGVPANSIGEDNDWALSDNGHIYFRASGTWSQKV